MSPFDIIFVLKRIEHWQIHMKFGRGADRYGGALGRISRNKGSRNIDPD